VRGSKVFYTPAGVLTGAGRTNGGGEASGSGQFRVGGWVWRGRYKRRVSSCSRVIVYSMFVPFLIECVHTLKVTDNVSNDFLPFTFYY
jgi:hypothetical protein